MKKLKIEDFETYVKSLITRKKTVFLEKRRQRKQCSLSCNQADSEDMWIVDSKTTTNMTNRESVVKEIAFDHRCSEEKRVDDCKRICNG